MPFRTADAYRGLEERHALWSWRGSLWNGHWKAGELEGLLGGKHMKSCSGIHAVFAHWPAFPRKPLRPGRLSAGGGPGTRTTASRGTDSRGRILSDSRVGHDMASNHTVKRLFPSQFSLRMSVSVGRVQEEVQLAAHTFNTSLAQGSSPPLTKTETAGASRVKLVQLNSNQTGSRYPFYSRTLLVASELVFLLVPPLLKRFFQRNVHKSKMNQIK